MFKEVKKTSAYWNLLNKVRNTTAHKNIGPVKRKDSSLALADEEEASLMNSYFATVGDKLAAVLQSLADNGQQPILNATNARTEPPPLAEFTITQRSVQNKVNALKAHSKHLVRTNTFNKKNAPRNSDPTKYPLHCKPESKGMDIQRLQAQYRSRQAIVDLVVRQIICCKQSFDI